MREEWRSVVGFEGLYEVSNRGRVKSLERKVFYDRRSRIFPEKILSQNIKRQGYREVSLSKNSTPSFRRVHRLVLEAFVSLRPKNMECRHLDGDSSNNCLENLVWGSHADNIADSIRHGTWVHGEKQGGARLTAAEAKYIRNAKEKQKILAKKFGVSQQLVSKIKTNGCWRSINA